MKIRDRIRKFIGFDELRWQQVETLRTMQQGIIDACYEVLTNREPYLACVTFMGETFRGDYLSRHELIPAAFGAELFISPGEHKHVAIPVQWPVGRISYFVSGHPNIVITSIAVGNDHQLPNTDGVKFGNFIKAVDTGVHLNVTIAFRTASK